MKAVLSFTADPLYSFFVPIAVQSWSKLGVNCIVFHPTAMDGTKRFNLIREYCPTAKFYGFTSEPKREPTYAQVSRLFASALNLPEDERLITTDADMAVFSNVLLEEPVEILVIGGDLVDGYQLPMCYVSTHVWKWKLLMGIEKSDTYHSMLEKTIDHIQGQNIRGEQWCLDQFLITRAIKTSGLKYRIFERAKSLQHRVATNRADRDYWQNIDYVNLIDAHLPRPGYEIGNWNKICDLFFQMQLKKGIDYNLSMLNEYRNKFLTTL